jgi:hypothetical protein
MERASTAQTFYENPAVSAEQDESKHDVPSEHADRPMCINAEFLELSAPFQWARTWSKWSGAVPRNSQVQRGEGFASPPAMSAYLMLSILYYFAFQLAWTGYTYTTARHTQTHGEV